MSRAWVGALALVLVAGCAPAESTSVDAGGEASVATCADDTRCDDGLFCNGVERCSPGSAGADALGCVRSDVPCVAGQRCDEAMQRCLSNCSVAPDADGDGADSIECGGADCDDTNPRRYPLATEVCDDANVDEDCDSTTFGTRDADGDGYIDVECCNPDGATMRCGDDCSDSRRDMHPGFAETCDFLDNDCDSTVDEVVAVPGFADADRDLHGDPSMPLSACPDTPGFASVGDDCDDEDPEVHRAQLEICDRKDNDCDGMTDEAPAAVTWYADDDDDGFGIDGARTIVSCDPVPAFSLRPSDCDDADRARNPAARELCNGEDDDCDGRADFMIRPGDYEDDDGDGMADATCGGADCDDSNASIRPGAPELCDGLDNDCDGRVDGADAMAEWFLDLDGDGFGDEGSPPIVDCDPQPARVPRGGDCDDLDAAIRPGVRDVCDGRDQDCDVAIDEDSARFAYYVDDDGDGWGLSSGPVVFACIAPRGRALRAGDCEDGSATRYPGATELCNLADDDCDTRVDEDAPTTWYPDADRDGHGVTAGAIETCAPPSGYASVADDCDDGSPVRFPGNTETCDLVDNDCDAAVDDMALCPVVHGTGTCAAGVCGVTSCETGYASCDGRYDTGCEVDTTRTTTHCGGCGMSCDPGDTCGRITPSSCDEASIASMIAGDASTMLLMSTGTMLGWGSGTGGRLGTGGSAHQPIALPLFTDVRSYAPGDGHSCLATTAGRVFCTGANGYGQLGDGTSFDRPSWVLVPALMAATQVGVGQHHSCALRSDGTVWCWGRRSYGQVGDGVVSPSSTLTTPTMVPSIDDAVELSVGLNHTCVRRSIVTGGFRVTCWGANNYGQLGDGTTATPRATLGDVVALPTDVVAFFRGYSDRTCMRTSAGGMRCWGHTGFGAIASGDTARDGATPSVVTGTERSGAAVSDVVAGCNGIFLGCVLRDRGAGTMGHEVWCSGADDVGQLGDGSTTMTGAVGRLQPVVGLGGTGVLDDAIAVSCGRRFACAGLADGRAVCWGVDEVENLGNGTGTTTATPTPTPVLGL